MRAAGVENSLIMLTADEADRIHRTVPKSSGRVAERVSQLKAMAEKQVTQGSWKTLLRADAAWVAFVDLIVATS